MQQKKGKNSIKKEIFIQMKELKTETTMKKRMMNMKIINIIIKMNNVKKKQKQKMIMFMKIQIQNL